MKPLKITFESEGLIELVLEEGLGSIWWGTVCYPFKQTDDMNTVVEEIVGLLGLKGIKFTYVENILFTVIADWLEVS